MTVPVQTPINSYTYAGSATFVYAFAIFAATDLQVTVDGVVKTLNTDYTVSGVGVLAGGSITYTGALTIGQNVTLERVTQLLRSNDYQDQGDFLAATFNRDFDRIWMALQERKLGEQQVSIASLRVPEATGVPVLPLANLRASTLLGFDSVGNPALAGPVSGSATALALLLAGPTGASYIGVQQPHTGSVATTALKKLLETIDAVDDYLCDNTGATNTTTQLLAFYNACILSGKRGHIPAGNYLVTPGVLNFYSGGVTKFWPEISTAGYQATTFTVDPSTHVNAPILRITNVVTDGLQTFVGSFYWLGGSHGGVSFVDATGDAAPLRSAWSLAGIWFCEFGEMQGTTLRGDLITVPANYAAGFNPDPYSVAFPHFRALIGNNLAGAVMNNLNGVGLDSCVCDQVTNYYSHSTTWFGIGQGCVLRQWSTAGCLGYCFDDGTAAGTGLATGFNRLTIDVAEFDACQAIFRLNHGNLIDIKNVRVNHRFGTAAGALNTSGKYWPLLVLDVTGGSNPNVSDCRIQIFNRIEAGGALADLGQFIDCHSSSSDTDLRVVVDYADNGGLGVTDAWITASAHITPSSMTVQLLRHSKVLFDSLDKSLSYAIGSNATTVPNAGFGTPAAKIVFGTAQVLPSVSTAYSLATSTYTAPRAGLYKVKTSIPLTCAIGTRVRIAFVTTVGGVECRKDDYQVNAGLQHYVVDGEVFLNAGDTVYVTADQNTGTAAMAITIASNSNEARFVVVPL